VIGRGSFIRASTLMALLGVVCLQIAALAQATSTQSSSDPDAEVAAIMDSILVRGEGHVGNVKTSTWSPPSAEDIERIREIGHNAIAPLNKALNFPRRSFQQLLAVKLLGEIGGTDVVPSLKRALEPDKPNSVRFAALFALLNVPDDLALPIIRSAVRDSDPVVARFAEQLLADYYQLPVPR
jgi:hypothetical protein